MNIYALYLFPELNNVLGTVTRPRAGQTRKCGSILDTNKWFLFSPTSSIQTTEPTQFLSRWIMVACPQVPSSLAWNWPPSPSSARINDKWSYTSTAPYIITSCAGIIVHCYHDYRAIVGLGFLTVEVSLSHSGTPHLVGLLWTSDRPAAETSTWLHITLYRNRLPCHWRDSNLQSLHNRAALRPLCNRDRPFTFTSINSENA